jgi:hypothetical protein
MPDAKYQRIIEIPDDKLRSLIEEKGKIVDSGRAISRELTGIQEQHEKLTAELTSMAGKVGDLSRKIFDRVKKLAEGQLAEWEVPITTEIRDGKVVLIASDALEEFKDTLKKQDKFAAPEAPKKLAANKKEI